MNSLPTLIVAITGGVVGFAFLLIYHCVVMRREDVHNASVPVRPLPHLVVAQYDEEEMLSSLKASITELIPPRNYAKEIGLVSKMEDNMCSVCLSEFLSGETVRILPYCQHLFHMQCIDMWLLAHSSCPICRTNATPTQSMSGD